MNQTYAHALRCNAMNHHPATQESYVAERLGVWVGDAMRLKRVDRATERRPDEYVLSALRMIMSCGLQNV